MKTRIRALCNSVGMSISLSLLIASASQAQTEFIAYDNLSTLSSLGSDYLSALPNDFSVTVGAGIVTSLVADDIKTVGTDNPFRLTEMSFYITNLNVSSVQVRPLIRLWNDDRFLEPVGDVPNTLLGAFTLPAVNLPAAPDNSFSLTLITYRFPDNGVLVPRTSPGRDNAFWAGVVFDNDGGRTGASLASMNNVGLLVNDVFNNSHPNGDVIIGNSGNVLWGTTNISGAIDYGDPGTDAFAHDLPPGYAFTVTNPPPTPPLDKPYANVAFQFKAINGFAVPEPGSLGLLVLGLCGIVLPMVRRRMI